MSKKINKNSIQHFYTLHTKLKEALEDDDLVVSLALDKDAVTGKPLYILAVSVHKSKKYQFNHDRLQQSCVMSNTDLADNADQVINTLITMYKEILIPKAAELTEEQLQAVKNKYDVNITLRDQNGNIL